MALQFAITSSGTMVMQSAINLFGSEAVAAYTAAGKIHGLLTQGMVAMGQTMAVYSGQNYGKGDAGRIRQGVRAALIIEVIYSVASAVVVSAALGPSLGLFFSGEVDLAAMMPLGQNVYNHLYPVLCAFMYYFYLPKYHAGLRIRLSAYDGRSGRAGSPSDRSSDRYGYSQLLAGLRLRSCRLGGSRSVYRHFLSVCNKED